MRNIIENTDNLEKLVIMKKSDYHDEELEIVDFMENAIPQSVVNLNEAVKQLKVSVKAKTSKRKAINLRLLESDLESIKTEAIREGIPYQTLIGSILHKYIKGNLAR